MPRKAQQKKQVIRVMVNGKPIKVTLHPPNWNQKSWYAYWSGLPSRVSTGQTRLDDAIVTAQAMIQNEGKPPKLSDATLSDEEFSNLQVAHYNRRKDPNAAARAAKTLEDCLDAINAFKEITGLERIASATPDDCAKFQQKALNLPKNWRQQYPKSKPTTERVSPNTVLKWSRSLQASFGRANRNAGRKCVRGVVEESKLLTANPWTQFTWIEGTTSPIRQFTPDELISLLDFLETDWRGVPTGATAAKVFLWSCCRKQEIASLKWDSLRSVGDEVHFEITGKWGVERWFRIPTDVYEELLNFRTESPFVFAAYCEQIRQAHANNPGCLKKIKSNFIPSNFGRWFYQRVKQWSKNRLDGKAFVHHFRKTGLQHARRGEDINKLVAEDVRVGETVMMSSYVKETDEELRARSNRTFRRILASLNTELARRYGYTEEGSTTLEQQMAEAMNTKNWTLVSELSAKLANESSR